MVEISESESESEKWKVLQLAPKGAVSPSLLQLAPKGAVSPSLLQLAPKGGGSPLISVSIMYDMFKFSWGVVPP